MASPSLTCVLVLLTVSGSAQMKVHQSHHMSAAEGSSATIGCFVEDEDIQHLNVQWFKQLPETPPTFILHHSNESTILWGGSYQDRGQPIRNSSNAHFLRITNITTQDSALYWCVLTKAPNDHVWGDGTQLSIYGGEEVQQPSVSLLTSPQSPASPQLLYFVCSINNFYPPVIEVTWKLDGQSTPVTASTGPFLSEENNSYTMISILELSVHHGKNLSSVSCEVRHDSSRTLITKDFFDCYRGT
ncbi:immunoglobulin lambda-1 light chain-like [Hyperolius riggenbachi]|uniref:immunoglobulin lambda-1 light chain-like n=1 Tax=Hyperolius riggenbachi TaxID=752182 RepID=UPI0035A39087